MTHVATPVPTPSQETQEEAFSCDLGDVSNEFENNSDPKGDACCYEPKCPCHGE